MIFEFEVQDTRLDHIFDCGQTFRWNPAEDNDPDRILKYRGAAGGYAAVITMIPDEAAQNKDSGRLIIEATGGDEAFWRNYLDLNRDYSAIKRILTECEPGIETAICEGSGIRILNQDYYEMLISFIISQNNNIPRIKKCIESICDHYGEEIVMPSDASDELRNLSLRSFPKPEVLASCNVSELAELKLGYRCEYIVESSKRYLEVGKPSGENLREQLLAHHGVGPKVANCILLFGLGQIDAFPIDVWVKRIMNEMYGFKESDLKGMQKFASEKFGEYGGMAQQYLFYYFRSKR